MAPTHAGVLYARGAEAESYFAVLSEQIMLFNDLGCELVNLGSDPDTFQYDGWEEQAIVNLRRAGSIAEKYHMRVALEDGNLSRTVALVNRTDMENVGYCIDFFWYFKKQQTVEQFYSFDFTKLFNVHFCDLPDGFDVATMDDSVRVLPGDGVLPLIGYANKMKDAGYDGYLCLELLNKRIWNMTAEQASEACMRAMRPFAAL
jgi:sugar phosphate isomerase/epimerase